MATVNITTWTDADFHRTFVWQTLVGDPVDLTGGTMEMMLRRRAEDQAAVLRLGTDTGEIVFTDAINGQFTVLITQAALERLGPGDFDQSNIFTRAGSKARVWSGLLISNAGPTR
jgi:hypothetical protein